MNLRLKEEGAEVGRVQELNVVGTSLTITVSGITGTLTLNPDLTGNSLTLVGDLTCANVHLPAGGKLNLEGAGGDSYIIFTGTSIDVYVNGVLAGQFK